MRVKLNYDNLHFSLILAALAMSLFKTPVTWFISGKGAMQIWKIIIIYYWAKTKNN